MGQKQQLPYYCTVHLWAVRVCCLISSESFFLFLDHANAILACTCTVGRGSTFSVAVTVKVGADLGLNFDEIASAGLAASVSVTTETGTTDDAGIECNGPWSCALLMTPTMLEVTGTRTIFKSFCDESESTSDPYTVRFPIKEDNTPKAGFAACACKNKN